MRRALLALIVTAGLGACSEEARGPFDLAQDLAQQIGPNTTVPIFDHVLFDSGHQNNDAQVNLPSGLFSSVILHVQLNCPTVCDQWDRIGSIMIVLPNGEGDGGPAKTIEVGRFITTFGVAGAWDIDVTDLQPLLTGTITLRCHIETWVSAGSQFGNGWLLTSQLVYTGGVPMPEPFAAIPLDWHDFPIGDTTKPIAMSLPPQAVALPSGATGALVRINVTGHGQGNALNCGEFCSLDHHLAVDGQPAATQTVWKGDCDQNPSNHQHGTWQDPRAGWCPGEAVIPWRADLGARPQSFTLTYSVDDYENTCAPNDCTPATCAFLTSCNYDGGNHTPPFYAMSAVVIAYR